jgi:hypothetical protein
MTISERVARLAAPLLARAGAAWPIDTEIRWRRTGDFEA